jgi:LysR family glycine cleavage system transcriptional activator
MSDRKIESLPLEWIRVFEAAGRLGNFTAAANETGLTQAAVSQRIRNLEDRIGAQLFTRQARGVTLTVDGEAWLPYVTNALQAVNRSAEDLFGKPLKKITISSSSAVTQLWVIPRLHQISGKAKYQISLSMVGLEASYSKLNAMIEIRYGSGDWPSVRKKRLFKESLTPLASPSLLQDGVDWQNLPRIGVSGPRQGWQEWSQKTNSAPPPVPILRFDSFVTAHSAAVAGIGIILGSLPLCAKELANKSLVRLSDDTLEFESGYWMISQEEKLPQKQWDELSNCLSSP